MYLEYLFPSFYPELSSSLLVRWYVSWMQEKSGSCIQSVTLCLFVEELKTLILRIINEHCLLILVILLLQVLQLPRERYPDLLGNRSIPTVMKAYPGYLHCEEKGILTYWEIRLYLKLRSHGEWSCHGILLLRERAVMAEFCSVLLKAFPSERIHFFSIPAQDVISSASLCFRGDPCRNVAISSGKFLLLLPSPKGLPSRDVSCFFCSAPLRKFLSRDSAPRSKRFSPKIFQDIYLARRSPGE